MAVAPHECAGQAVRKDESLFACDIDELVAEGDERCPRSLRRHPLISPQPAVALRSGIDTAKEGRDGRATAVSLNALAGYDGHLGIIGQ